MWPVTGIPLGDGVRGRGEWAEMVDGMGKEEEEKVLRITKLAGKR